MAKADSAVIIDTNCAPSLNRLAREQMKLKLMQDIRTDLIVCEIEGWSKITIVSIVLGRRKGASDVCTR